MKQKNKVVLGGSIVSCISRLMYEKLTVAPLWSSLRMERAISTCGPWHVDE